MDLHPRLWASARVLAIGFSMRGAEPGLDVSGYGVRRRPRVRFFRGGRLPTVPLFL